MAQLGYTSQEHEQTAAGYRFLTVAFSGLYRATEKPFIAHLVGTASILVTYRAPIDWVLAGLLHAVCAAGDFGFDPGTRRTARKQGRICDLIGRDANDIIIAYDAIHWHESSVNDYVHHYQ